MDQVPQSSFIPRQSGNMLAQQPRKKRGRLNLLSFFALVCFFGSIILAMGAFLLERGHQNELQDKKEELAKKEADFKIDSIDSVRALDTRIRTAEYLIDNHVSPSILLDLLERTTQEEIQYTTFQFARRPSNNVSVSMLGIAPRFNTVAGQARRFAEKDFFSHVIFSGLNKPQPTYVSFQVDLDISKDAIAYDAVAPIVEDVVADTTTASSSDTGLLLNGGGEDASVHSTNDDSL